MIAICYTTIREVGLELQLSPDSVLCSWEPSVRRHKPDAKRHQAGVDWNWCFWWYLRRYSAVPGTYTGSVGGCVSCVSGWPRARGCPDVFFLIISVLAFSVAVR